MPVEWKQRMKVIDHARVGEVIVEWATGERPLPEDFSQFRDAMDAGFLIVQEAGAEEPRAASIAMDRDPPITDEDNEVAFVPIRHIRFIRTRRDTIVIKLPPKHMIERSRERYTALGFPIEAYPFPSYQQIDIQKLKDSGIDAAEMFYSEVGDYTTSECA